MFRTTSTILLVSLLGALPAMAEMNQDTSGTTSDKETRHSSAKAALTKSEKNSADLAVPEGFVVIEDFAAVDLKQLPLDLLRTADSDFAAKNLGESAADLRAAARVFRLESKQAKGADRHLADASDDLDRLAADVKNEVIKSDDSFHSRLTRALYHDAAHHRLQALHEWDMKRYQTAGADLRASAVSAEMASRWTGNDLVASTKPAIDNARRVAGELSRNEGWTSTDVSHALDALQGAEERIASRVMPSSDKAKAAETAPAEM